MTFHSLYSHGFARVAACTADVYIADPLRNAAGIVEVAGALLGAGRRGRACSRNWRSPATRIDDLLGADALLDAVHDGLATVIAASRDLLPVIVVGAPLRHQARLFNTAVVIHRGEVLGVVPEAAPAELPGVLRAAPVRRRSTASPGCRSTSPGGRRRSAPTCCSTAADVERADHRRRDLRGHVRPGPAVQRAGAGRRDGAGQPLRQPDHHRPGRHPQPAVPQPSRCAAWPPTCTPRPVRGSPPPT